MLPCIIAGTPNIDYRFTRRFGVRPDIYGPGGHDGIDIAPKIAGTTTQKVRAPHEGFLKHMWDPDGYGLYVLLISDIYGPDKRRRASILGHSSKILVPNGAFVYQMQDVMIMGETGFAVGEHTHWTYYITDQMGRKLNMDNGHRGALDIAGDVIVDGGKRLSAFLPPATLTKKAKKLGVEDACATLSPLSTEDYLPLP